MMIRFLSVVLLATAAVSAKDLPELPLYGIAHVAYRATDLAKSAEFYTGILGYREAFRFSAEDGKPESVFFKINDQQFLRLDQVDSPAPDDRLVEIAFRTTDIKALHRQLKARGLAPSAIEMRRDGNPYVTLVDPEGHQIAFVEYKPNSQQVALDRQLLVRERLSTMLWHSGVHVRDKANMDAFYQDKLGFSPYWTGSRDGKPLYVHMDIPGLEQNFFEYLVQYGEIDRERLGSTHHICLRVDDIDNALEEAHERGLPRTERHAAKVGMVKHWLANLFDPDGTRVEFMEPHYVE